MDGCEALNTDESPKRRLPKHAQTFLQERDYGFARLDGQMVRKSRDDAMSRFETDPNCTVFLISLKCGSLGLNLTAASQVILVSSVVCAPSLRASIGISFIGVAGLGVAVRRLQDGSVVEPGTCGAAGVWAPDIAAAADEYAEVFFYGANNAHRRPRTRRSTACTGSVSSARSTSCAS